MQADDRVEFVYGGDETLLPPLQGYWQVSVQSLSQMQPEPQQQPEIPRHESRHLLHALAVPLLPLDEDEDDDDPVPRRY